MRLRTIVIITRIAVAPKVTWMVSMMAVKFPMVTLVRSVTSDCTIMRLSTARARTWKRCKAYGGMARCIWNRWTPTAMKRLPSI